MLGSIEKLALQPLGFTVGAVGSGRGCIPQSIILGGVGNIPGIVNLEGIGAFQIPEVPHRIAEDNTVIMALGQILGDGILQDSRHIALRSGDGHGNQTGIGIVVALGITEIVLLAQLGGRRDIPAVHLFKGVGIAAPGNHDLFLEFHIGRTVMAGIEQIVGIVDLHHRAGTGPSILTAAAVSFQNRLVILGIGHKIGGGCKINGVVVGVAAILQIVYVVDTVLVIGHGVAHIGLAGAIHIGEEIGSIFIGGFLAAGSSEGREILVIAAGLNFIGGFRIPQSIQGQIRLNLVFIKVPGGGHGGIAVPALQHITLPLYILRLGDLAALFQSLSSRIFTAVIIRVEVNGIGAAGLAAAQQQTENQQQPYQALFHFGLLVSVALTEGM